MISCCSEPFFSFVPFPSPVVSEASGPYFFFPPGSLRIFGLRLQQAAKLGDPMASNLLADRYAREEDAAHDAVRFYRQAKLFGVANRPPCWVEKILWSPVRTTIFLGWYASTKRKRHGESLWPFFWLKQTVAVWLASIFCLQIDDTLHFCGFPSNIAIIQSIPKYQSFFERVFATNQENLQRFRVRTLNFSFFVGQPKSAPGCVVWTVTNALQYWNLGPFLLRTR